MTCVPCDVGVVSHAVKSNTGNVRVTEFLIPPFPLVASSPEATVR
jgi:hypothetical protein